MLLMVSLCCDPQSAALALEYGLPTPAAGVAHPVRTRKRASSPAAGLEPAARRQRTLARRANTRPSYEERSESDPDEPSSNGNNWPARGRRKHRPAPEAKPPQKLAPPEPVNVQTEPKEDDKMMSWAAIGKRTQRFRQRSQRFDFDPLRMGNITGEPPLLFLFYMLNPRECVRVTVTPATACLCTR